MEVNNHLLLTIRRRFHYRISAWYVMYFLCVTVFIMLIVRVGINIFVH